MSLIEKLSCYGVVDVDTEEDMLSLSNWLIKASVSFKVVFDDGIAQFYLIEPEDQK